MSAKEIIESQMNGMRHDIAHANQQIGKIEECLDIMGKILGKFEVTDMEGVGYRYCYTQQQKENLNELMVDMLSACRRA